jgi:hypothetical protein
MHNKREHITRNGHLKIKPTEESDLKKKAVFSNLI